MPSTTTLAAFAAASLLLILLPGRRLAAGLSYLALGGYTAVGGQGKA